MNTCRNHPYTAAAAACGRCGQAYCDSCLVEFLGSRFCEPCRNFRLAEVQGAAGTTAPCYAGTGQVDLGRWLSLGWQHIQNDLLTFAVAFLLAGVLTLFSCGLAGPALFCGLYLMVFRKMLTGRVEIANLFDGFRRFLWALLAGLLVGVASYMAALVFTVPEIVLTLTSKDSTALLLLARLFSYGGQFLVSALVSGAAFFTLPLIAARNLNPVEALTASWEVFRRNPVMFSVAGFLLQLIGNLGAVACLVGVLFTFPLMLAATAQAYADHFGLRGDEFV